MGSRREYDFTFCKEPFLGSAISTGSRPCHPSPPLAPFYHEGFRVLKPDCSEVWFEVWIAPTVRWILLLISGAPRQTNTRLLSGIRVLVIVLVSGILLHYQ